MYPLQNFILAKLCNFRHVVKRKKKRDLPQSSKSANIYRCKLHVINVERSQIFYIFYDVFWIFFSRN